MKEVRNIECGRVAFIAKGECEGKLGVIAEIIDQNRVLIDGPLTGVVRQAINITSLHLTSLKVHLPHGSRTKVVRKEWIKADISKKWDESTWAKKLKQKSIRSNLNDFERFQVRQALRNVIYFIHSCFITNIFL